MPKAEVRMADGSVPGDFESETPNTLSNRIKQFGLVPTTLREIYDFAMGRPMAAADTAARDVYRTAPYIGAGAEAARKANQPPPGASGWDDVKHFGKFLLDVIPQAVSAGKVDLSGAGRKPFLEPSDTPASAGIQAMPEQEKTNLSGVGKFFDDLIGGSASAVAALPAFEGAGMAVGGAAGKILPQALKLKAAMSTPVRLALHGAQSAATGAAIETAAGGSPSDIAKSAAKWSLFAPAGEFQSLPGKMGFMAAAFSAPDAVQMAKSAWQYDNAANDEEREKAKGDFVKGTLGLVQNAIIGGGLAALGHNESMSPWSKDTQWLPSRQVTLYRDPTATGKEADVWHVSNGPIDQVKGVPIRERQVVTTPAVSGEDLKKSVVESLTDLGYTPKQAEKHAAVIGRLMAFTTKGDVGVINPDAQRALETFDWNAVRDVSALKRIADATGVDLQRDVLSDSAVKTLDQAKAKLKQLALTAKANYQQNQPLLDYWKMLVENSPNNGKSVSVPIMITRSMEQELLRRGFTQQQINKLTPQEANDILKQPSTAKPNEQQTTTATPPPPAVTVDPNNIEETQRQLEAEIQRKLDEATKAQQGEQTLPEGQADIDAQLQSTAKGDKPATLIPQSYLDAGGSFTVPDGLTTHTEPGWGKVVYDPKRITPEEVAAKAKARDGTLIGLTTPAKPAGDEATKRVVRVFDSNGNALAEEVVDPANVEAVKAKLQQNFPSAAQIDDVPQPQAIIDRAKRQSQPPVPTPTAPPTPPPAVTANPTAPAVPSVVSDEDGPVINDAHDEVVAAAKTGNRAAVEEAINKFEDRVINNGKNGRRIRVAKDDVENAELELAKSGFSEESLKKLNEAKSALHQAKEDAYDDASRRAAILRARYLKRSAEELEVLRVINLVDELTRKAKNDSSVKPLLDEAILQLAEARKKLAATKGGDQRGEEMQGQGQTQVAPETTSGAVRKTGGTARGISARARFARESENVYDILAWIAGEAKLMSKTAAQRSGKWDRLKAEYDGAKPLRAPHHNLIFGGTLSPDQVAQMAYERGLIKDATVVELWDAIDHASEARIRQTKQDKSEEKYFEEEARKSDAFHKALQEGDIAKDVDTLSKGDRMVVDGEDVEVVDVDPEPPYLVTVKDGRKFGRQTLPSGATIYVEEFTPAPDEADPFAEKPPAKKEDSFSLESMTDEQLLAEKEKKAQQEAIDKGANRRLEASGIDTTGDMFDQNAADNPLFAPKPPTSSGPKVGKRPGQGVYVQASAIEGGRSNLTKAEIETFEKAKAILPAGVDYDFVHIQGDVVRFLKMSSLEEAHPHVVDSTVVSTATNSYSKGKTNGQLYHRMDTMVDPEHPSYPFHQAVTAWEEKHGLIGEGAPISKIGSKAEWHRWIEEKLKDRGGFAHYNEVIDGIKGVAMPKPLREPNSVRVPTPFEMLHGRELEGLRDRASRKVIDLARQGLMPDTETPADADRHVAELMLKMWVHDYVKSHPEFEEAERKYRQPPEEIKAKMESKGMEPEQPRPGDPKLLVIYEHSIGVGRIGEIIDYGRNKKSWGNIIGIAPLNSRYNYWQQPSGSKEGDSFMRVGSLTSDDNRIRIKQVTRNEYKIALGTGGSAIVRLAMDNPFSPEYTSTDPAILHEVLAGRTTTPRVSMTLDLAKELGIPPVKGDKILVGRGFEAMLSADQKQAIEKLGLSVRQFWDDIRDGNIENAKKIGAKTPPSRRAALQKKGMRTLTAEELGGAAEQAPAPSAGQDVVSYKDNQWRKTDAGWINVKTGNVTKSKPLVMQLDRLLNERKKMLNRTIPVVDWTKVSGDDYLSAKRSAAAYTRAVRRRHPGFDFKPWTPEEAYAHKTKLRSELAEWEKNEDARQQQERAEIDKIKTELEKHLSSEDFAYLSKRLDNQPYELARWKQISESLNDFKRAEPTPAEIERGSKLLRFMNDGRPASQLVENLAGILESSLERARRIIAAVNGQPEAVTAPKAAPTNPAGNLIAEKNQHAKDLGLDNLDFGGEAPPTDTNVRMAVSPYNEAYNRSKLEQISKVIAGYIAEKGITQPQMDMALRKRYGAAVETDLGEIWNRAAEMYEKATGIQLPRAAKAAEPKVPVYTGTTQEVSAKDPDLVLAVSRGEHHFTLWAKPKETRQWQYISILGGNREQALERAKAAASRIASGDMTGIAFYGKQQFTMPKSIGVSSQELSPEQLMGVEKVAIGEQTVGFGKYAAVKVKDLLAKDFDYANWLVENGSGRRAQQVADYLRSHPDYVSAKDAQIAEARQLVNEENKALLAKHGLTAEADMVGGFFVGGKTYEWKETIKQYGGSFDRDSQGWKLSVTGLKQLLEKLRGLPNPDGRSRLGLPAYTRDPRLGEIRRKADGRADTSQFTGPVTEFVSGKTADLIGLGRKVGMPEVVVQEQVEDVARINRAYRQGKRLFVLASEPGSGKTFVLGGSIRELRDAGAKKIVYVTLRNELITQIKQDLAQYGIDGVQFMTYPKMRETPPEDTDVVIFDEAHFIKNVGTGDEGAQQAAKAAQWIRRAKFTILSSATPFENPVQAQYLEPTGVFDDAFGGFDNFAMAYGATKIELKNGPTVLAWKRTQTSDADQKAARQFFVKEGVYTSRRIRLPDHQVDSRLVKVAVKDDLAKMYNAFSDAAAENEDRLMGFGRAWIINFQKRLLESAKVETGIHEAEDALKRGRNPILFVETKAERRLDIPDLIERERQYQVAVSQATAMGDEKPPRSAFGLPPVGVVETLATFMQKTGTAVILIPSAEDTIIDHFGEDKVAIFTGSVTPKVAQENLDQWRAGKKKIIVATMAKGGTGLSLHDKKGDHPTTQVNINLPWTATGVVQVAQRSARYGLKGMAEIQWLFADNIPFDRELSGRVGGRMADMGALVHGQEIKGSSEIEDFDFEDKPFSELNFGKQSEIKYAASDINGVEAIRSAAFRMPDGKVFTGPNHPEIALDLPDTYTQQDLDAAEDGFVTTHNRFVDRHEAYRIATETNQVKKKKYDKAAASMNIPGVLESQTFNEMARFAVSNEGPEYDAESLYARERALPRSLPMSQEFLSRARKRLSGYYRGLSNEAEAAAFRSMMRTRQAAYLTALDDATRARVDLQQAINEVSDVSNKTRTDFLRKLLDKAKSNPDGLTATIGAERLFSGLDASRLSYMARSYDEAIAYAERLKDPESLFYPRGRYLGAEYTAARYAISKSLLDAQEFQSTETCLNQVSAAINKLIKSGDIKQNVRVVDYGGGRYETATKKIGEIGAANLVFDPFNRSADHNLRIEQKLEEKPADIGIIANVLNVIKEPEIRVAALHDIAQMVKPDGKVAIQVYEGDKSGVGKATSKGWQENRKLASYLNEVKQAFGNATIRDGLIIASDPKPAPEGVLQPKPSQRAAKEFNVDDTVYINSTPFSYRGKVGGNAVVYNKKSGMQIQVPLDRLSSQPLQTPETGVEKAGTYEPTRQTPTLSGEGQEKRDYVLLERAARRGADRAANRINQAGRSDYAGAIRDAEVDIGWFDTADGQTFLAAAEKRGVVLAPMDMPDISMDGVYVEGTLIINTAGNRSISQLTSGYHELFHHLKYVGDPEAQQYIDAALDRPEDIQKQHEALRAIGINQRIEYTIEDVAADIYSAKHSGESFSRHGVQFTPDDWKATPAENAKADAQGEKTGYRPYTSAGQLDINLDEEPKYAIKQAGEGKYKDDPRLGIPLNGDGTVTLYYHTTAAEARRISQDRKIKGATKNSRRVFFTNESSGAEVLKSHGKLDQKLDGSVVLVHLDPNSLHIAERHEGGRVDFFVPIAEGKVFQRKMERVQLLGITKSREEAIEGATGFAEMRRGLEQAANDFKNMTPAEWRKEVSRARNILYEEHNVGLLVTTNTKMAKRPIMTTNAKLERSENAPELKWEHNGKKKGIMSYGLALASAQRLRDKESSCPNSASCRSLCLADTSGNNWLFGGEGPQRVGPRLAQYLKTEAFVVHPREFGVVLLQDLKDFQKEAAAKGKWPSVRLNVNSDFHPRIFEPIHRALPDVMFYDYTKLPTEPISPNHHLTYSSTGVSQMIDGKLVFNPHSNWDAMMARLDKGQNVAMAFSSKSSIPQYVEAITKDAEGKPTVKRYRVINGDLFDARFVDPKGVIVGLKNKNQNTTEAEAVKKHNGFFVHYDPSQGPVVRIQDQANLYAKAAREGLVESPVRFAIGDKPKRDTFYHKSEQVAQEKLPAKGTGSQMLGILKNNGVKPAELVAVRDAAGVSLQDWLTGQQSVTKDDVLAFIQSGKVQVREVTRGRWDGANGFERASDLASEFNEKQDRYRVDISSDEDGITWDIYDVKRKAWIFDPMDVGDPIAREAIHEIIEATQKGTSSATKFQSYMKNVPTDEGYFEWVLTVPATSPRKRWLGQKARTMNAKLFATEAEAREFAGTDGTVKDWGQKTQVIGEDRPDDFQTPSSHAYGDEASDVNRIANVIGSIVTINGKKYLAIWEAQSDWAGELRKRGEKGVVSQEDLDARSDAQRRLIAALEKDDYLGFDNARQAMEAIRSHEDWIERWEASLETKNVGEEWKAIDDKIKMDEQGVPSNPLLKKWEEVAFKAMLKKAADMGLSGVVWNHGQTVADRYDLRRQVDEIELIRIQNPQRQEYRWAFYATKKGERVLNRGVNDEAELASYIGKEPARKLFEKIQANNSNIAVIEGEDLRVGGKWAENLYDRTLVNFANDYTKKWGGKVEAANFGDVDTSPLDEEEAAERYSEGEPVFIENNDGTFDRVTDSDDVENRMFWKDHNFFSSDKNRNALALHRLDFTPEMLDSIQGGQPLFAISSGEGREGARPQYSKGSPDDQVEFTIERPGKAPIKGSFNGLQYTHPAALPELLEFARELTFDVSMTSRLRSYLGYFKGMGEGEIRLSRKAQGQPLKLAQVLAHEIGHGIDWLPDRNLSRGNLIGRILSLTFRYLRNEFPSSKLDDPSNKAMREELKALSAWWTPWDRESASDHYRQYRDSAKELYAEFMSVLLNAPAEAQARAPLFYNKFFENLNKKPMVARQFLRLQSLLSDPDALYWHRKGNFDRMLDDAEAESRRIHQVAEAGRKSLAFLAVDGLIERDTALLRQARKLGDPAKAERIRMDIEELRTAGVLVQGALRNFQKEEAELLADPNLKLMVDQILFLERISAGDRWEFANPLGYTAAEADRQLKQAEKLEPETYKRARELADKFHEWVWNEGTIPMMEDIFTPEQIEMAKSSRGTYAAYRVTKYLKSYVSAGIIQQKGTVEDIGSPLVATIMKVAAMIKAAKRNDATKNVMNDFLADPSSGVVAAPVHRDASGKPVVPNSRDENMATVMWREKGKWKAAYVEKHIASSLGALPTQELRGLARFLRTISANPVFRQAYITYNLSFQVRNLWRDFLSTWKAQPDETLGDVLKSFVKVSGLYLDGDTWKIAKNRPKGVYDATIVEMEKAGAFGPTLNELIRTEDASDSELAAWYKRHGIGQHHIPSKNPTLHAITKLMDMIELGGNIIETVPKVVNWKANQQQMDVRRLAMFTRDYAGTPNPKRQGSWDVLTNNMFLFSRMRTQGMRRDSYLATMAPKTKAGWWWKTALVTLIPKVLMAAALYGLFGDWMKKQFEKISAYRLRNYTAWVVGQTKSGAAVVFSLPNDESGQLLGSILWTAIERHNDPKRLISELLGTAVGQLPISPANLAPGLNIAWQWGTLALGGKPVDRFRQQDILTDDEIKAGGWYEMRPMLMWTLNQNGMARFEIRDAVRPDKKLWEDAVGLTPGINALFSVTDAGLVEKAKEAAEDVASTEAAQRIDERNRVREAVKAGEDRQEFAREGANNRQEYAQNLRQYDRALLRKDDDPTVRAILGATSTAQKLAVLNQGSSQFNTESDYLDYLKGLIRSKAISVDVAKLALRQYRQQRQTALAE